MADRTMKLITGVSVVDEEQQLEYKTYPYPIFVKGGLIKKAIDLAAKLESGDNEFSGATVDELADFVVEVYANQFTRDELIDGLQAHEVIPKLSGVLEFVITGEEQQGKQRQFIQEKTN